MAREITCIAVDQVATGVRIDSVGGNGWTKREATVIAEIDAGLEYFVEVDGRLVDVIVAEGEGRKHLRSDPAETTQNDLLLLPTLDGSDSGLEAAALRSDSSWDRRTS